MIAEDSPPCPHCGTDQVGEPIPEEHLLAGYYHLPDQPWDGVTPEYYSRTIGIEISGIYDGVLFWQCPDCGGKWHRFPEGDYRRSRADRYVNP